MSNALANPAALTVVTGASSGIGAAAAHLLAKKGLRLALLARRQERLHKLVDEIRRAGGLAWAYPCDLSDSAQRLQVIDEIVQDHGPVEVLVNNAGLGWYGYYADMPWEITQEMIQVNMGAAVHLARLVLPEMRQANRGHIINIGSVVGSLPSQGVAIYSASKSFLSAFTTSLYRELSGSQVHASVINAGPVKTEFFQQTASRPGSSLIPVERFAISAEAVASQIWRLILKPRRAVYVPGMLALVPWIELVFGRLQDRIGPLLLQRRLH
jgi:hypothetical protein